MADGDGTRGDGEQLRRNLAELKERVDLHDLAQKLGLQRPKGSGNYRSPGHADKSPSLSIFDGGRAWKDWSADIGGDCISLVQYVLGGEFIDAARWLHDQYGLQWPKRDAPAQPRERSQASFIADMCLKTPDNAIEYLREQRRIPEETIRAAIKAKSVGWSDYTSPKKAAGEVGHQGPCVAFIAYDHSTGFPEGVDKRFIDPELNGGVKTQSWGAKQGLAWTMDRKLLAKARTIYVVESAINALSIEACGLKGAAALATRGLAFEDIDWTRFHGKQLIICFDADTLNERGHRPGPEASWRLYDLLTSLNIGCMLVDQSKWLDLDLNDCNDVLKARGVQGLKVALEVLQDASIQGLSYRYEKGPKRVWLPAYDFHTYARFRVKPDFTQYISDFGDPEGGGEDDGEKEPKQPTLVPLAGFRVASLTRVSIQSAKATYSGVADPAPQVQFAATVQVPSEGPCLLRKVMRRSELHKKSQWEEFGPIYNEQHFKRMVSILERTVHFSARRAANFVGVCWLDGKLRVNEGTDCYFERPDKQCHYHEHVFHRGNPADARPIIEAYQATFTQNAAMMPLVWALGAPALKTILGFWPHLEMQAKKGTGKSTYIDRLSATTGFTMFSSEQLKTSYRIITSISHSSMPVGWEEVSKAGKQAWAAAITTLQECYQFNPHSRGSDNLRYLNAAPVLLAGEDVPSKDIAGKIVRTRLTIEKQGPELRHNLPQWPMRQWLEWICTHDADTLREDHKRLSEHCKTSSRAKPNDPGAKRMSANYAALLLAWRLMCDFAGIDRKTGGFVTDCIGEMNAHIKDTEHDREPYIWILEKLSSELAAGKFIYPHAYQLRSPGKDINGVEAPREACLIVRAQHVMDHLSSAIHLRDWFDQLPIKTHRVFKSQCVDAGIVVDDNVHVIIDGRDQHHCLALSVPRLQAKGIDLPAPAELGEQARSEAAGNLW